MTVSTEISSNEYTGNGVTTDFDYKFRIFKANQLSVITSDADGDNVVTLRLGTDYTVTGVNKSTGGKVILIRPLAGKRKISITREIPIKQETSFRNQSKFFAEMHEDAFDYLTMILQRIWGSLGSLYLKRPNILANWFDAKGYRIANLGKPKRDTDAVDLGTLNDEISGVNSTVLKREKRVLRVDDLDIEALPKANVRAGNVLTFDKDGKPIVVAPASGSAVDVLNQLGRESGANLSGFSHDALYAPATVGHKLKNSVWVTDAPFNAKMDGATDDTVAFQKAIDSGKIVQIPMGDTVVSNLTIYPNTTIIGCGRRHGIHVTSGTQILYKGAINTDWLTLADREGMIGDGQGGITLKSFTCINASSYLELPSSTSEPYYLYRPNAQKVLEGNSRGLFAVESTHVDWGTHSDWRAAKEGGVNCPFLIIDDVKLQNFTYPLDAHSWMCQISNFEPYLCGPVRLSGTSTKITNSWPRYPLSVAWQSGVQYSNMSASSLGEGVYNNTGNSGGLECYFGFVSLDDIGYELIRGTVLNAYKGTINVNGLTGVTGSTDRPSRLGKISGADGFIIWGSIPKMQNREGEQISLAFNLFTAISEDLLGNHIFQTPIHAKNLWITNPWESKLGNSSQFEYFAPYVSQSDNTIIGSPFVTYPLRDNKTREVGSLKVGYKNSVLIRGAGRVHRFRIFGSFDDGVTSAASTNPRQKHGMLRIDFTHYASPLADGVSSASDNFKTAYAVLTFSRTLEGRVYDIVLSDSVSTGVDKPIFFRVNQESDGGFTVEFGVTRQQDGNDDYRQCLLGVKYSGSYPRNTDNNTVSLILG
ncbi:TPA: hypothetical protein U2I32_000717 [Providencia rettgeri]|nr:hypothetical protein [Providencia rettgeri]